MLTPKEQELIKELFFKGKSEHQISREINIAQRTIHDRKVRILSKLKKLMENKSMVKGTFSGYENVPFFARLVGARRAE